MRFLLEGVQYNDEQLQENCVALFARSECLACFNAQPCRHAYLHMHWLLSTESISNVLCHADFHTSYTQTAEGLPPDTIEAILTHKVQVLSAGC